MPEFLAVKYARDRVESFASADESWMREHQDAMDCLDCEAFLQLGIDAFRWLIRADMAYRKSLYSEFETDPKGAEEVENILRALFVLWLRPCELAHRWIDKHAERGFEVGNLDEFSQCEQEIRAIVRSFADDQLPEKMAALRDQALEEHRRGETSRLISE
jgi:hypothetical protein